MLMSTFGGTVAAVLLITRATALDNNVANTPPLGWCSWQRYRCAIHCNDSTSLECFNEGLIKRTADAMLAGGYLAAGYNYIALDDCWQGVDASGSSRDANGHIFADKQVRCAATGERVRREGGGAALVHEQERLTKCAPPPPRVG
jgi:hypothetical protein